MIKKSLVILLLGMFAFSVVSAENFTTKIDFEITGFEGISSLDNSDGHVLISISPKSGGGEQVRSAVKGIYLENMTLTMNESVTLNYSTNYTYNLSTVYGDFLFNFTTPDEPSLGNPLDYHISNTWNDSKDYFVQLNTTEGNRTILDEGTGLIWQDGYKDDGGLGLGWDSAKNYCNNLDWSGLSDWRLPTAGEYMSMINWNYGGKTSYTEGNYYPSAFTTKSENWFWTSTTMPSDSRYACIADMLVGGISVDDLPNKSARCVHDPL